MLFDLLQTFTDLWPDIKMETKSCALFHDNKTLWMFGNEAEKKYEQLVKVGKHREHYFVRLFNQDGCPDVVLTCLSFVVILNNMSMKKM